MTLLLSCVAPDVEAALLVDSRDHGSDLVAAVLQQTVTPPSSLYDWGDVHVSPLELSS